MGKPTGFMEYSRKENRMRRADERCHDWDEFYLPISDEERKRQGARCMNCGVPYCQAGITFEGKNFGCPLHNLIPEWNDMIMDGNFEHALSRLLKTNNFPEFTGRVCPAFCEQACICGIYGDAVTIHNNELSIIETAFAEDKMKLRIPPHRSGKKIAVVGSGPSGLAVADQLNHRGHSVTVFERDEFPGGILMYGIPNMKLPKTVVKRRTDFMAQEGVTFVTGFDASLPENAQKLMAEYDAVVLCCGAEQPRDIGVDISAASGVYYAMQYLHSAVERSVYGREGSAPSAKGRNVVIIGTGNTASDCVASAIREGCKSVIQLVRRPKEDYLAADGTLPQDYAQEEAAAMFGTDPRVFSSSVRELVCEAGVLKAVKTSQGEVYDCELLIAATGFAGCRSDVCTAFGVEKKQTVVTEKECYATNVEKVFTAGDMHRGQSLVVWAIKEGRAAAAEVDEFLMGYTNMK
ncbi:MAG: glutamate synthase subunit beta [Oscillospiraceae bacterium]|nr:glutamate synthase subunit beta [Oscillospiraceae bacterium]